MKNDPDPAIFIPDEANVSEFLSRIINNCFYVPHPFKLSSGQMSEVAQTATEILGLDPVDYAHCLRAIEALIADQRGSCWSCYGQGLTFAKYLTTHREPERHRIFAEELHRLQNARDTGRDYEAAVLALLPPIDAVGAKPEE